LSLLADVPDPRRGQGQVYKLPYVLLFSILAIVTGCNSYRGIVTFIDVHRHKLNATFGLKWRRAPAYTAVRYILKRLDPADVEPLAQSVLAEALRNVAKHAAPERVEVAVSRDEDTLMLEVRNDGVRAGARGAGMGLRLAAFEALQHEGVVEFGSPGPGLWRVRLVVPLKREAA